MKILAHIGDDGVMVQMTRRELANITGRDYPSEMPGYSDRGGAFRIGQDFAVCPAWHRLREQERVQQQLEGAAKSLESIAALIRYEAPRCSPPVDEAAKEGGAS